MRMICGSAAEIALESCEFHLTDMHRQTKYRAMTSINGDALRGHLETLILSALRRGDAHGFEILRRLEEAGSGALQLKEGSLYPALYRLEASGMVKGKWEDGDTPRGGPFIISRQKASDGLKRHAANFNYLSM